MLRIFKSKLFLLILATVIILIGIGISASRGGRTGWASNLINTAFSPFQKFFTFTGQRIESGLSFLKDIKAVKEENEILRKQVEQLTNENANLKSYGDKIQELRKVLNLKDRFSDYESIGANIIATDMGNWFNVFTIDRGSKDGIGVNYPVISGNGLVGCVVSVDPFTSKIVTITDMDSTVYGRILKTGDLVRVRGDLSLKDQGLCVMDHIDVNVDVAYGDIIETSGLGGIYPKGIVIGKVKQVMQAENELYRYAIIEPAVDFKKLEEVVVLINKSGTEIGSVEK